MKVAVWGADTFVGSNICNYMLQYTKNDIFGIFVGRPPYKHMEGPLRSRSRFDWQVTTSNHEAIDLRLQAESPDIVLIATSIPEILKNRFRTCYIGQDSSESGASSMFMVPEPFGPRQPRDSGIASIILGDMPAQNSTKTVIYIKDLYDQLMLFLESGAKYGSASGITTSTHDIWSAAHSEVAVESVLQTAVLHTAGWYSANKWFV